MLSLAYTISPELQNEIVTSGFLRQKILLTNISPRAELKIRWNSEIIRLQDLLNLINLPLGKNEILPFLLAHNPPRSTTGKTIISLHTLLTNVYLNWTANTKPFKIDDLEDLISEIVEEKLRKSLLKLINGNYQSLTKLFNYLQSDREQALIIAGICQVEIPAVVGMSDLSIFLGRLVSLVFLYKNGYDLRNFVIISSAKTRELEELRSEIVQTRASGNATAFLVWYCQKLQNSLDILLSEIKTLPLSDTRSDPYSLLNRRQQEIFALLDNPEAKITNRDVQKRYGISQITASRDLARLSALNLANTHGKGRSVYYTRF